jgi:GNAT acetyltransferase-like protein
MPFELKELTSGDLGSYASYVGRLGESNLFHSLPWLEFITREHAGWLQVLEIRRDGRFHGYWPLVSVRKMGFTLMGSPLRGWLTSHMGPLLEGPLEMEVMDLLMRYCRQKRIAYLELAGSRLEPGMMAAAGFAVKERETWVLDIESNEQDQWDRLEHNCRKNIRKAQRSDLKVLPVDGPDHFPRLYELVVRTFRKKGMAVPYGYRRLALLQETIGAGGQMIYLGAFHQGEFIGGHIWGHDRHTAYALVVGHDETYDPLRVTNLLLWEGIRRFVQLGLKKYDMYGGSRTLTGVTRFKASFGSSYVATPYYCLGLSPLFRQALFVYENWYLRALQSLRRRQLASKPEAP